MLIPIATEGVYFLSFYDSTEKLKRIHIPPPKKIIQTSPDQDSQIKEVGAVIAGDID